MDRDPHRAIEVELITKAVAGDRQAGWDLLQRYQQRLRWMIVRYARWIPPQDRDDYQSYLNLLLSRRIHAYRLDKYEFWRYLRMRVRQEQRDYLEQKSVRPPPGQTIPVSGDETGDEGSPFEIRSPEPLQADRVMMRRRLEAVLTRIFQLDTAPHHLIVFAFDRLAKWPPDTLAQSDVWNARVRALLAVLSTAVFYETDGQVRLRPFLAPLARTMDSTLGDVITNRQLKKTYQPLLGSVVGDLRLSSCYAAFRSAAEQRKRVAEARRKAQDRKASDRWRPPTPQQAVTKWCEYVGKSIENFPEAPRSSERTRPDSEEVS